MRHMKIAAFAFLTALSTAGCVEVGGPYYGRPVVRQYYGPSYGYYAPPPQVVYVQPYYPRHRHHRWRD